MVEYHFYVHDFVTCQASKFDLYSPAIVFYSVCLNHCSVGHGGYENFVECIHANCLFFLDKDFL